MASPTSKSRTTEQAAELVAFVSDEISFDTIRNLIAELVLPHSLVRIGGIDDAIAYLKNAPRPPEQLIVDISGLTMPLSEVNRLADVCEPSINVVAIGDRTDIGLFRDLMRLGVTDYIAKPVTTNLLQRCLSFQGHAAEAARQYRAGKLVSVVGARGGIGATTVATTLAWLLSNQLSRRVVLIDLDVHTGGVNMMLNLQTNQGLLEALQNPHRIDPVFLEHILVAHGPRLLTLTSEILLQDEAQMPSAVLPELIAMLQQHFHYIILDAPLHGGSLLSSVLDKADVNLFVTDTSAISLRNLLKLGKLTNPQKLQQRSVVICNQIRPDSADVGTRSDFEAALRHRIDFVIPYGGAHIATAEDLGEVYLHHPPEFAKAILAVANDLSGLPIERQKMDWRNTLWKGWRNVRAKALR